MLNAIKILLSRCFIGSHSVEAITLRLTAVIDDLDNLSDAKSQRAAHLNTRLDVAESLHEIRLKEIYKEQDSLRAELCAEIRLAESECGKAARIANNCRAILDL